METRLVPLVYYVTRTRVWVSEMGTYPCIRLVNFLNRNYRDTDLNLDMVARIRYVGQKV